jgi:hypothetical protein
MKKVRSSLIGTAVLLAVACALVCGCVQYKSFPQDYVGKKPAKEYKTLYYNILNGTVFGGYQRLNDVFRSESPFEETIKTDTPQPGLYVRVRIEQVIPSAASLIFAYISASTLTLTPVWSTQDGYDVYYEIYKDGVLAKQFNYQVRRDAFVWIVMAPFAWVNAFTYNEGEAMEATAFKFFADAGGYLQ